MNQQGGPLTCHFLGEVLDVLLGGGVVVHGLVGIYRRRTRRASICREVDRTEARRVVSSFSVDALTYASVASPLPTEWGAVVMYVAPSWHA